MFLLFLLQFTFVLSQSSDSCSNQNTCNECIQTKGCAWCSDSNSDETSRCFPAYLNKCAKDFMENPKNRVKFLKDDNLTKKRVKGNQKIVQIKPQRMSLELRINEPQRVTIKFSRAQDYPVDLYYLMDLSFSMNDDKEKLSALGKKIADVMTKVTKDFRLGFGSFVDKTTLPYASTVPWKDQPYCYKCVAPYGYKNHMKLNTDADRFEREVRDAPISKNIDAPEGGFDALMQVIVCNEEIGWREQARRLVVFSTDASFHYAGDGKLGGVITPNDGKCHMENHTYTHSLIQDYPSVAQINLKAKENAMNLIFAVTADVKGVYQKLSEHIEASTVSTLDKDSGNIVQLIEEQYKKISSTVEMKDNANEFLQLKYSSKCLSGRKFETKTCDRIKVGDEIEFTIDITATSCRAKQSLKIYPIGIDESLIIDIDTICTCSCEDPNSPLFALNSTKCQNKGTHKCGVCECNEGFTGRQCECSSHSNNTITDLTSQCFSKDNPEIECNGQGNCVCGICDCFKRPNPKEIFSGKYCECDNFSCERFEGQLCGGPDRGECKCEVNVSKCQCNPGWTGTDCSCSTSQETCRAPDETAVCSDYGECVCGKCKCAKTGENRRSGWFCEKCPECKGRCSYFKDCVQCLVYQTGPLSNSTELCNKTCANQFSLTTHKTINETQSDDEQLCESYDENSCRYRFIYNDHDQNNVIIRAEEKLYCSAKERTFTIIVSIVGSILLIGLATLLLWKCITTIQYRREFTRFEQERMNACWGSGDNPLYREATSTYVNPTYVKSEPYVL